MKFCLNFDGSAPKHNLILVQKIQEEKINSINIVYLFVMYKITKILELIAVPDHETVVIPFS